MSVNVFKNFYIELKKIAKVSDVVGRDIKLIKKGREYIGLCPFHQEKTPSFTINDHKGFYHCFGCGVHGDSINFIEEKYRLSYKDAAIKLAGMFNISVPKINQSLLMQNKEVDFLYKVMEISLLYFQKQLSTKILSYLNSRNISNELIKKFEIGFTDSNSLYSYLEKKKIPVMYMHKSGLINKSDKGDLYQVFRSRIIFPIRDVYNNLVGFGGRSMGNILPKYLNSPETILFNKKQVLYGENIAISEAYKTNNFIIVEGYTDVIAMYRAGFKQSVAILGTAITRDHLKKLFSIVDEVVLSMDSDNAGLNAIKKAIILMLDIISPIKKMTIMFLPEGKDPADVIESGGLYNINKLFKNRFSLSKYIFYIESSKINPEIPEEISLLEMRLEKYISKISDNIIKKNFNHYFRSELYKLRRRKYEVNGKTVNFSLGVLKNSSERSILEESILYLILKNLDLLDNIDVRIFLESQVFDSQKLESFKYFILSISNRKTSEIESLINNSEFKELYHKMISNKFVANSKDIFLNWRLLKLKFELMLLQNEYYNLLLSVNNNSYKKIKCYELEITRLSKQINVITNEILLK